jgi:phosphoserine phosphatase
MSKVKLVCFDLNKTLIKENSWLKLNTALGMTKAEDQMLFKLWEEGSMTYKQWQDIISKIYVTRGIPTRQKIEKVLFDYEYKPYVKEVIQYLKSKDYRLALLTGSEVSLARRVANELGFDMYGAVNIFIYDEKDLFKDIIVLGDEEPFKLYQLNSFCFELGIKLTECACIGDGANELELFKHTKHGITFKGSKIEKSAWKVINELSDVRNFL